ncbi:MAG: cadherin-like beta sandwich domain-containing protein, partial [Bacilli bacterium]|nr:cadherin-like beta sandwich domain-containing protein [Bacilli bacterium]
DDVEQNVFVDNRLVKNGGTFPSKWDGADSDCAVASDGIAAINLSTPVKKVTYYSNQKDQPLAFVFLKLKESAPAGESIDFSYFSDVDNYIETMGQNIDNEPLDFNIYNAENLTVFGQAAVPTTLAGIEVIYNVQDTNHTSILNPSFLSSIYEYGTTVPNAASSVTIKLPLSDESTTITSSSGTLREVADGYELDVTGLVATVDEDTINNVEFSVIETIEGEDTPRIKVYTIHITRIDNNTDFTLTLSGIDPDDITYDAETKTYTASTTLSSTVVTATPNNAEAVVTSGTGEWNLNDGENISSIVVNGADCQTKHSQVPGHTCTTNTYTVKVTKLSTDARLQTLTVTSAKEDGTATSGTLNPIFNVSDAEDTVYTYTYPEGTSKITVAGTVVAINKATITSGTGDFILADGITSTTITVTAEDGETTRDYTINFVRKLSDDGSLKSLTVTSVNGNHTLTPDFSSIQQNYTLSVPHEIDRVTIAAEATSPNAKSVTGTGELLLDTFDQITREIVVTAEDDTPTTYTLKITREKSNNANLTDIKVNGTTITGFDKNTITYTLPDVRGDVTNIDIEYTKEEPHTTVNVTGTTLHDGVNTITLTATAQDGSTQKAYTISVKRLSNNANLQSLSVTSDPAGTLTPEFSENTTSYVYKYDRNVGNILVTATAVSRVPVVGTGSINPAVTKNVTLTSTSEDGTPKVYTISFVQELENDSSLASLIVKNGEINYSPVLKPGTTNKYTLTVPGDVDAVELIATPNGSYVQNVDGEGTIRKNVSLNTGLNTEIFEVIAEDGTRTTYTVEITRTQNTEAFLTSLTIAGEVVEDFSPTTYTYNFEVPNNRTQIIIAETHSLGATITGNSGPHALDRIGVNTIKIKVTSEDGAAENTYTINVKRKSRDASITSLTATSTPVSVVEKTSDLAYRVDVPHEATSVTLVPIVASGATVLDPDDLVNIDPTTTPIVNIRVQAEDGNISTYAITINVLPSSNAFLGSLYITPGALKETFNKETTSYTASVGTDIDKIEVFATAEDGGTIEGDGEHDLNYGDNTIVVKVTAQDDTVKNYTITVTRMKKDNKSLSDLKIDGTTISGFERDKTSYTLNVPYNTTSIDIDAIPEDSDASVSGDGTIPIAGNSTTITFTVKAHNNTTRDYTIIVNRSLNNETRPTNVYLAGYLATWNETDGVYEVTLDSELASVGPEQLEANLPHGASFVSKGTEVELTTGQTDFEYNFTVKAQDNHQDNYTIKINRSRSTANTLNSLTSNTGTLSPTFASDQLNYTLTLPLGTTTFAITANKTSARSTMIGDGEYTLPVNNNKVLVTVTSEDNTPKIYEITIAMEADHDVLETLSVEGFTLDPTFDGTTLNYSIGNVEMDIDTLTVHATTTNSDLTIKYVDGNNSETTNNVLSIPSNIGENSVKVRLENSTGDVIKTYTINYNKKGLERIVSSVHTLDDNYVLTARPNVQISDFITQFDNEPETLFIYASDGTTKITDKIIATGMHIKLERNDTVLDQLQIVILGDTNGDGKITINDAALIVNHTLGSLISNDAAKIAADVNKDGKISINDAAMIVNHTLGTSIYRSE